MKTARRILLVVLALAHHAWAESTARHVVENKGNGVIEQTIEYSDPETFGRTCHYVTVIRVTGMETTMNCTTVPPPPEPEPPVVVPAPNPDDYGAAQERWRRRMSGGQQ